ncbi:MAG: hypothetical protein GXO80_07145 [Chlorobi bacterium]|nr:hypothetical protein [Chlorobiota bacterium]
MIKYNPDFPVKLFVFGTLRKGGRLDYYTDGSLFAGKHYTEGQLMLSEIGSTYIDFDIKNTATVGELYYMNYSGLLRIDHLESTSGEFPKGYDLDITPIWKLENKDLDFPETEKSFAFVYKRRNSPVKIKSGDWMQRPQPIEEIKKFLNERDKQDFTPDDLISYIQSYLKK